MGRGDFPYLLSQYYEYCYNAYRYSSLYARNVGFFVVGGLSGAAYGILCQLRSSDHSSGEVYLSQFSPMPRLSGLPNTHERRRVFEKQWGAVARTLQRQHGYIYTQMFRSTFSNRFTGEIALENSSNAVLAGGKILKKGIRPLLEQESRLNEQGNTRKKEDSDFFKGIPVHPEYYQLQSWLSEPDREQAISKTKADVVDADMTVGYLKVETNKYYTVFDDSMVRLIQ